MMADLSETHRRLLLDAGTALGTFLLLVLPLVALGIPEEAAVIGWSTLMVASLAFRRVNPLLAVVVCAVAGTGMVLQVPSPVPAMLVVLVIVFSAARHLSATAGLVTDAIFAVIIMSVLAIRFYKAYGSLDTSKATNLRG